MTTALTTTFSKLSAILILICLLLAATYSVKAEDSSTSAGTTGTTRKDLIQQKAQDRKAVVQNRIETRKENVQDRIAAMKEKMASREAALKAKLDAFKDKRKAQIAERVNTNLNRINKERTDQMLKHLQLMTTLLNKLEDRVNKATSDIKDPTSAKVAIATSRTAIETATTAVNAQAEKDYTITVTTETAVKADAQKMREQLHSDLQATRKLVIDAKQSVSNAVRTAKSGQMVKEATPSGQ